MNILIKKIIFVALLLGSMQQTKPLIIGSNTLVSLESLVTFPEIDILFDNIIRAFAWMKNGFKLENSDTELEFQSTYPVLGTVDLRGGTLTLDQDLIFKNVTTLDGLGIIIGNGHAIKLCSSITQLPSDTDTFDTVDLFFDGNIALQSEVTFSGKCLIDGNGNRLNLTDGSIKVDSGSTLCLRDLDLSGIQEGKIYCVDDTASLVLENVDWVQDDSITFDTGSILFRDKVTFSGTGTFVLSSKFTSTVQEAAMWKITDNLIFSTGRHAENNAEPLYFENKNAVLYLDNIAFEGFSTGFTLTNGSIIFNRDITLDFNGTTTQTGVILGNGNPQNDIHTLLNPGSSIDHRSGYWVYNNGQKDRLKSNSSSAKLLRREGSKIFVAKDLELQRSTIDIDSNIVAPIEVGSGVMLSYLNSVVKLPDVELDIKANQLSSFIYQLDGDDTIFFTRGTLPLGIVITNQGNIIKGNGSISGPIIFSNSLSELSLGIVSELRNEVSLANGTLQVTAPLTLNNAGIITGPGKVDLDICTIILSKGIDIWPTAIEWISNQGEISLLSSLSLCDTWTFSGDLTLNGNGNTLSLDTLGGLTIGKDTTLVLKNIQLIGVKGNNIKCLDDTGTISFLNSSWILDGDCSFTTGTLYFERNNSLEGNYDFSYETVQSSTIAQDSSLTCNGNLNFKLGRSSSTTTNEPLIFASKTSKLILDQATLNVQQYGYQLTKGTLVSNRNNTFEMQSTHTGNGLMLGNGIQDEDITIQLNPGSTLNLKKGHLVYNLFDSQQGFVSQSQTAQISRSANFIAHYMRDADINNITFVLTPPALFTQDPNTQVTFSNLLAVTPIGQFNVTGRRVSIIEIALEGNDKLDVKSGQFSSLLSISGTNNVISGEGAVGGIVTLVDSATQLFSSLSGTYLKTIVLNNGTLVLSGANKLGNTVALTGPGAINLNSYTLDFGHSNTIWDTPLLWSGAQASIGVHANVSLKSTWTISGSVLIKGHGFGLHLSDDAEIVVSDGAQLCLENLKIENLSGTKIKCLGDGSELVLENTAFELGGDYHFPRGSLGFKGDVKIGGMNYIFGYETNQTSTIHSESCLYIDELCTFSYDPSSAQSNLLEFEDSTSLLLFKNSSLIATNTGFHLCSGAIEIRGDVLFESFKKRNADDTFDDPGISLGDGVSGDNDTDLIIDIGSILQISEGSLRYNNIKAVSLSMGNGLSRIQLLQDTILYVNQTMNLEGGVLLFERGAGIKKASGKTLIGSVFVN